MNSIYECWGLIDQPNYKYISPFVGSNGGDAQKALLSEPFRQCFEKHPEAIGRADDKDTVAVHMAYVKTTVETWMAYFNVDDIPLAWTTFVANRAVSGVEQWHGVRIPDVVAWRTASSDERARRTIIAHKLVEKMAFALLVPHPSEWTEHCKPVIHILPTPLALGMWFEHAEPFSLAVDEVSIYQ